MSRNQGENVVMGLTVSTLTLVPLLTLRTHKEAATIRKHVVMGMTVATGVASTLILRRRREADRMDRMAPTRPAMVSFVADHSHTTYNAG